MFPLGSQRLNRPMPFQELALAIYFLPKVGPVLYQCLVHHFSRLVSAGFAPASHDKPRIAKDIQDLPILIVELTACRAPACIGNPLCGITYAYQTNERSHSSLTS